MNKWLQWTTFWPILKDDLRAPLLNPLNREWQNSAELNSRPGVSLKEGRGVQGYYTVLLQGGAGVLRASHLQIEMTSAHGNFLGRNSIGSSAMMQRKYNIV